MTTNQIKEAVKNYIRDEEAKYAIMIDGAWGSGKTYLYKNHLIEAIDSIERGKNKRKHNVYISLYGISNIDKLSKQLIFNYLIYTKGRGKKTIKYGIETLGGFLGIACGAFSFSAGPISVSFSKISKQIEKFINVKNMVICFDDLERCTIPINELFGFVNNLVEHSNCKVLILADEGNIGKIYANTNLEKKYLTVLSGNRKIVTHKEESHSSSQQANRGKEANEEITIEEAKKLNELLYSENYIYKDIKEKIIGKTFFYYPDLKSVIVELMNGNNKKKGIIQDEAYKVFLQEQLDSIVNYFEETENRNIRIIKSWLFDFKKIFNYLNTYYKDDKYYENIVEEFLHYSIWVEGSTKKNKKIIYSSNNLNQNLVYFEGHEYNRINKHKFIDAWIIREVWNDKDISKACKSIIDRYEKESIYNPKRINSSGVELRNLKEWYLLKDEQVYTTIGRLKTELKENKYAFQDYSSILYKLLYIKEMGFDTIDLHSIQEVMLSLIKNDSIVQEVNDYFPWDYPSKEFKDKYLKLYNPIVEERKTQNKRINKEDCEESDIYRNATSFFDNCSKMENYYCNNRSFIDYINIDKLINLIKNSNLEDLYTIRKSFSKVYYMGNLKDFYKEDIEGLKYIRNKILDMDSQGEITRKIALNSLAECIKSKLILLGVGEEEL